MMLRLHSWHMPSPVEEPDANERFIRFKGAQYLSRVPERYHCLNEPALAGMLLPLQARAASGNAEGVLWASMLKFPVFSNTNTYFTSGFSGSTPQPSSGHPRCPATFPSRSDSARTMPPCARRKATIHVAPIAWPLQLLKSTLLNPMPRS